MARVASFLDPESQEFRGFGSSSDVEEVPERCPSKAACGP